MDVEQQPHGAGSSGAGPPLLRELLLQQQMETAGAASAEAMDDADDPGEDDAAAMQVLLLLLLAGGLQPAHQPTRHTGVRMLPFRRTTTRTMTMSALWVREAAAQHAGAGAASPAMGAAC